MADYIDDELPLPSFFEIFGDGFQSAKKKRRSHASNGSKIDSLFSDENTAGRWTADEHRLFLEGIMLYGKDWKKMQAIIKTRTLVQIRTHAQKVFKKVGLRKIGPGSVAQAEAAAAAAEYGLSFENPSSSSSSLNIGQIPGNSNQHLLNSAAVMGDMINDNGHSMGHNNNQTINNNINYENYENDENDINIVSTEIMQGRVRSDSQLSIGLSVRTSSRTGDRRILQMEMNGNSVKMRNEDDDEEYLRNIGNENENENENEIEGEGEGEGDGDGDGTIDDNDEDEEEDEEDVLDAVTNNWIQQRQAQAQAQQHTDQQSHVHALTQSHVRTHGDDSLENLGQHNSLNSTSSSSSSPQSSRLFPSHSFHCTNNINIYPNHDPDTQYSSSSAPNTTSYTTSDVQHLNQNRNSSKQNHRPRSNSQNSRSYEDNPLSSSFLSNNISSSSSSSYHSNSLPLFPSSRGNAHSDTPHNTQYTHIPPTHSESHTLNSTHTIHSMPSSSPLSSPAFQSEKSTDNPDDIDDDIDDEEKENGNETENEIDDIRTELDRPKYYNTLLITETHLSQDEIIESSDDEKRKKRKTIGVEYQDSEVVQRRERGRAVGDAEEEFLKRTEKSSNNNNDENDNVVPWKFENNFFHGNNFNQNGVHDDDKSHLRKLIETETARNTVSVPESVVPVSSSSTATAASSTNEWTRDDMKTENERKDIDHAENYLKYLKYDENSIIIVSDK